MGQACAPQQGRADSGALRATLLTVVVHGIALVSVGALLHLGVKRSMETGEMFRHLRIPLPWLTQVVYQLDALVREWAVIGGPLVLCADAAVYAVLRTRARTRAVSTVWAIGVLVVLLACAALIVVGLRLPLRELRTQVQQG